MEYNWWEDPKNEEEVKRLSWWLDPKNQCTIDLPISLVSDGRYWVASTKNKNKMPLGDLLDCCSQGETKEEAIQELFDSIKFLHYLTHDRMLSYERWVPFRKGNWGSIGGTWFAIFGIHVYFRYGKGMNGGWYIPMTKLNIIVYSHWSSYKNWKRQRIKSNE